MARRLQLEPQLTIEELGGRYRSTKDPVERSRGHFLWLLARVLTAKVIASIAWYSANWIGRSARRYSQHGPDGVKDLRISHDRAPGSWPHRSRTSWRSAGGGLSACGRTLDWAAAPCEGVLVHVVA